MSFPVISEQLKGKFDQNFPGFWDWWARAKKYFAILDTEKGGSLILSNNAGTITKRVRLNDAGTDLIFEDV